MKYKLGDLVVSKKVIGIITGINQVDERYDSITDRYIPNTLTTYYNIGQSKNNPVEESEILGKLEIVK